MSDYDNDLMLEGIQRFRAKEFDSARSYFERALDMADDQNTRLWANYYLSRLTPDPLKKRSFLEETLAIDMTHAEARRDLAILDGRLKPGEIVNPDQIPAPAPGPTAVKADRFVCPTCGGRMVYSPDGASLVCEYCKRRQTLGVAAPAGNEDFFVAMANGSGFRKTLSIKTFRCQGCGANFILPPDQLSATCAYCGSAHVIALDRVSELVAPDAILPLAFDPPHAARLLAGWLEAHNIRPDGNLPTPRGLYLPVWAFDLLGNIPWNGRVLRNKREVPVSGEYPVQVSDIRIPGSHKLAALLVKFVAEYNLSAAPAYDPRYLSGWLAEVYQVAMSDAALDARQAAVEQVQVAIRGEFGNVLGLNYSSSSISITSFRLILLPVWTASYTTASRTWRVLINGQNGTVHTDAPLQGLKGWLENLIGN